jgi:hypothetical protein
MSFLEFCREYKVVIDFFGALLGPIIAITVAYIAYQQWRTNKRREQREEAQAKLSVYRKAKKFLRYVDNTCKIDPNLFEKFAEAVAEADFLFPNDVRDWLADVESEASCWLNGCRDIELFRAQNPKEGEPDWIAREKKYMEEHIDKLQDAHVQLFSKFRKHIHPMGHRVQQVN